MKSGRVLLCLTVCNVCLILDAFCKDSPTAAVPGSLELPIPAIARAYGIVEIVLTNHVDPPTRQEMVLAGTKALFRAARKSPPAGLSTVISSRTTCAEFESLWLEAWKEATNSISPKELESVLIGGILSAVPGDPRIVSAKELKVQNQLAANRYVGIGIQVAWNNSAKYDGFSHIEAVFRDGPADKAGLKRDDMIKEIDGVNTHEMKLAQVIDLLRGDENSVVRLLVQSGSGSQPRSVSITRSVVPRETVVERPPFLDPEKTHSVSSSAIGYLRVNEIGGSTVLELRRFEQKMRAAGNSSLILDLRSVRGTLHNAVLLADALLDHGTIGQVRTCRDVTQYEAGQDCIFRDWPLVILVDRRTSGEVEWLAAALQDSKRAKVVGELTAGNGFTMTSVLLPDDGGAIMLATGLLERADGKPLRGGRVTQVNGPDFESLPETWGGVRPDRPIPNDPARDPRSEDPVIRAAVSVLQPPHINLNEPSK
jgi:carboxyl-terminal processing protease